MNRKFLGLEGAVAFRDWIRSELAANTPVRPVRAQDSDGHRFDQGQPGRRRTSRSCARRRRTMENTTHLFLAMRFNCNKCHDHPFERWTQDQYYQMAAYFAQVGLSKDPAGGDTIIGGTAVEAGKPLYEVVADKPQGEVKHDRTGAVTAPEFPFQCKHEATDDATRREELAAWITSPDNPYFARSYVNRLWGYLSGRGIIEPIDDIRAGNPPTNPELLDYLTAEFIDSGFDVRHVVELICKSRTYQLSIETNRWNEDDQINFSHARARRLPAEVLYDAIYRATGATSTFPGVPPGTRAAALPDVGVELPDGFLGNLGGPARESACECERSSDLQLGPVMALVSGPTVGDAISDPENGIAKLVADVADNGELVNRLFLRFLNRPGKPDEVSAASALFQQLEADNVKLAADLKAYQEELAPQIAARELERQNRVNQVQAVLDVERELAKLRRPREERQRQERVEAAQAALAEYDKQLAAKLPEWEAAHNGKTHWHAVTPTEIGATYRARFTPQSDRSIFIDGDKAKGAYRVAARVPLDRVTGVRLEALADDRLGNRGPGRSPGGNYVVSEFVVRTLPAGGPAKLVRSWDFSGSSDDWQAEDGAKVVADSGTRYLFGTGQQAGITTTLKEPAGSYLLEIVTGIRAGVTFTVQWSTAGQPAFDDTRFTPHVAPRRRWPLGYADRHPSRRGTDRTPHPDRRRAIGPADRRGPPVCGRE